MRFEDGRATARTFAQEWMQYGHHKGTDRYLARVRSVTKEDVLAAAYRYLHPGRIQMVIVGPIDRVREAKNTEGGRELEAFGRMISVAETLSTE